MASSGIGISVGSHVVRAVKLRKKGDAVQLQRYASFRVEPGDVDTMVGGQASAVTANLSKHDLKGAPTFVGLSGKDLVIRYTHVPPVPDWKLETLMRYEIEEVSQQSGGDVSADYAVLDLSATDSTENVVLVAMAKNSVLEPRVKMVEQLGGRFGAAVPNSLVLFNAYLAFGPSHPDETVLIARIGGNNIDIAIQKDGDLLFARNVSGGGGSFTEAIMHAFGAPRERAEKMKLQKGNVTPKSAARYADSMEEKVANAIMGVAGQTVSAIQSSIMFARAQTRLSDLSVNRVVLAGGGANLRGLAPYLEANLGLPVSRFDPSRMLDLSALPEDERAAVEADGAGLVIALGLAQMASEGGGVFWVEILPEAHRKRRDFMRGPLYAVLAAVAAAVLLVVLYTTKSQALDELTKAQASARSAQRIAENEQSGYVVTQASYERAWRNLDRLRSEASMGPVLARALALVQENVPEAITFNHVRTSWVDVSTRGGDASRTRSRKAAPLQRAAVRFTGRLRSAENVDVWTTFVRAVQRAPGTEVKESFDPRSRETEITISFPPAPPAEEGD